jgi:carboxymethylenebutenolidase
MPETSFTCTTPDGAMECFRADPDGAPRGAVVVLQEAFGVNGYIRRVCAALAGEGFTAVAPALYHRAGGGTAAYDDVATAAPLMASLTDAGVLVDVGAALDALGTPRDSTGVLGFCVGGRMAFLAATEWRLGAAVSFYGGGIVTQRGGLPAILDRAPRLATPWLGIFGDRDHAIPVEDVETLRAALPPGNPVVRFPEAGHGFHCDERDSYHQRHAGEAWALALAWLGSHL